MKQAQFLTHSIIVPTETRERTDVYLGQLTAGASQAGKLLAARINQKPIRSFSDSDLLAELLKTKIPQIFAESMVRGDGSDWNLVELGLLGDISVGVPVEIYDNGHHTNPVVYDRPFQGTLVFTPGALLRNGCDCTPADWNEVVGSDSTISPRDSFHSTSADFYRSWNGSTHDLSKPDRLHLLQFPDWGVVNLRAHFAGLLEKCLNQFFDDYSQKMLPICHTFALFISTHIANAQTSVRKSMKSIFWFVLSELQEMQISPNFARPKLTKNRQENLMDVSYIASLPGIMSPGRATISSSGHVVPTTESKPPPQTPCTD